MQITGIQTYIRLLDQNKIQNHPAAETDNI